MKIAVGGMIAAGKSNLVRRLGQALEMPVMPEYREDDDVFSTLLQWLYDGKPNTEMLLQIYFLHDAWLRQSEFGSHFIVDRDIIEHWLFAQENLKPYPEIMNMYNGVFHSYINQIHNPDLYIILDVDWKHFKERIFNRQRSQEVNNFEKNATYFASLLNNYVQRMRAQCVIFNIPYIIINTNDLNEEEIFDLVMKKVKPIVKKNQKELHKNEEGL